MTVDSDNDNDEIAALATISQQLEALRLGWSDCYLIGHDAEHGWWASRRDQIGGLLTAAEPDELRNAIRTDFAMKPPRS